MSEFKSNHGETREVKDLAIEIENLAGSNPELAKGYLDQIDSIANQNDPFAHYVLASYHVFGRYPQTYDFHTKYDADALRPYIELNTLKGFGHYIQAISAPDNIFQDFQIQALYEMYMTISGRSALFTTFEISNRPEPQTQHPLSNLFEKRDTLLMMLLELGHSEIYLDVANHFMDQGETSEKIIEALNLAIEHSVCWDLRREALFKLGEIHYYGKFGITADVVVAKSFWSRIDDDRSLARIANHYLKLDNIEEAKSILLNLKNPDDVVGLFSGYPEIVELISKRDSFSGLLDQAFGFQLQFPQVANTIDARRFYSELSLEQILAEDEAEQPGDNSDGESGNGDQNETNDVHQQLDSDTPEDEANEGHVDESPVEAKEITAEQLTAINDDQNDIADGFEILTDDDSDTENAIQDQHDDTYGNEEDDPFGEPLDPEDDDAFPDFD